MSLPAASSVLVMRSRSVWEAADSGILLWRDNFFYFVPLFAAPLCIAASCLFLIPEQFRWLSFLSLWWLKPLFDRLCLHVVSSRFFRPGAGAVSNHGGTELNFPNYPRSGLRGILRGFSGNFFPFLFGDLLWRRFSPMRSAAMPLRILERSGLKQYAGRKSVLASGGLGFGAFLSCFGLLAEVVLLAGEIIFVMTISEIFFPSVSLSLRVNSAKIVPFIYCAYCFNYFLVESLYVCMGFGLYINSRTEVEGWDLQLLFRKFSGKIMNKAGVFFLLIGFFIFVPQINAGDFAETEAGSPEIVIDKSEQDYFPPGFMPAESVPVKKLEEILLSEDFGRTRQGWRLRLKNSVDEDEPLPEIEFAPWLEKIKEGLAHGLRILVIVVIAGFIVIAIIRLRRLGRSETVFRRDAKARADTLISAKNPEETFEAAEGFFKRRLFREAWAACIRGTIDAFNVYFDISFPPDATEYGCLDLVRSRFGTAGGTEAAGANKKIIEGFSALIRYWVLFAYGGRNPPEGSFEEALEFGRKLKSNASGTAEGSVA